MGGARAARSEVAEENRWNNQKSQGHVAGAQLPKINIIMQSGGERKVGQSDNTQRDLSSSNKVGVKIADETSQGISDPQEGSAVSGGCKDAEVHDQGFLTGCNHVHGVCAKYPLFVFPRTQNAGPTENETAKNSRK